MSSTDFASGSQTSYFGGGNLIATGADTAPGKAVEVILPFGSGTASVQITGTFSATLLVEQSNDGGNTWSTLDTLTSTGLHTYIVAAMTNFRVRCSAYTSGNAGVAIVISPAGSSSANIRTMQFVIDGGGSVVATGAKGQISIPYACTITGWVLTADQSGSAVVDVLRSTYAAFPTTVSIAGTDKPTLASVQKNENLGPLSGWGSTAINAGDEIQINVGSATTVTRLNLTLNVTTP